MSVPPRFHQTFRPTVSDTVNSIPPNKDTTDDTVHASVKNDIVGVVAAGTVIAHVASVDSTDSHVSVTKDIVGIIKEDEKVVIENATMEENVDMADSVGANDAQKQDEADVDKAVDDAEMATKNENSDEGPSSANGP